MEPKKILKELKNNKLIDDKFIFISGVVPSQGGSLATSLSGEIVVSVKGEEVVFTPIKNDKMQIQNAKSYNRAKLAEVKYGGLFSKKITFIFNRGQYVKLKISNLFEHNAKKIIRVTSEEYWG